MLWRKHEAFLHVIDGAVEVLSFGRVSMMIVFAIHNIKVLNMAVSHVCHLMFIGWLGVNRRPMLPIVFWLRIKEREFFLTIRRRLINILKLVSILMISTTFIEKLLELGVIKMVIFTVCYMCSIIPRRTVVVLHSCFISPFAWTLTIRRLRFRHIFGWIPFLSYNLIQCLNFHSVGSYLIIVININVLLLILLFHLQKKTVSLYFNYKL